MIYEEPNYDDDEILSKQLDLILEGLKILCEQVRLLSDEVIKLRKEMNHS